VAGNDKRISLQYCNNIIIEKVFYIKCKTVSKMHNLFLKNAIIKLLKSNHFNIFCSGSQPPRPAPGVNAKKLFFLRQ
jgi:hypothetical protein